MIQLRDLCKKYGEKEILQNINLTINSGEVTFLVGTSGAGKSTLLNLIGGLDRPTSGHVILNGLDIKDDLNSYRARNIGFVFQDFNLISGLSIAQNVEIATAFSGIPKSSESICEEIAALGISDPNQKIETLSGGEKQRAAVIRSICKDANIIIADEPTGNLDSSNAELVLSLICSLKTDKHIIIVSHDMEKARKYADRIITLRDGKIVEDEKLQQIQSAVESSKGAVFKELPRRLSSHFRAVITLGKNSVKLRKGKIFSIALVIALAIVSLTTVINLNQYGNELSHNVNVNYLENDLIHLYYNNTPNAGFMEMPFTAHTIQSIQNRYDIQDTVPIYLNENSNWLFSAGDKTASVCLKQININDFFKTRVLTNHIEGQFLSNKHEIILAEDVAQTLFDGECLGKEVTLHDGSGNQISMTIVGVNHTTNPLDKIYSFISADIIKELLTNQLETTLFQRQELFPYYTEVHSMTVGGLHGSMKMVEQNETLLYGKYPDSSDQIMISTELLSNVLNEFGIETDYTKDQVVMGKLSSEDIGKVFTKKLALKFNGVFALYISGVYESNEIEMRFTDALIREMKKVDPIAVDIYASNPDKVAEIKNSIHENEDFEASAQLETLKENVSMQTRFFSMALIVLGAILLVISVTLLSSFSKIAVLERRREVAIMKSLGASNRSVLSVLLFDSAAIALLSFVLALFLFSMIKFALPSILSDANILNLGFPVWLIVIISFLFALLVFLQTGLNLRKLVKKMPAELFVQ